MFGVQWHPERNFGEEKKFFENFLKICKNWAIIDKAGLPEEAKFLPISFPQFAEIINNSPDTNSLKIIENEQLEITIMSGEAKRYYQSQQKKNNHNFIFFCLFGMMLLCVLALKALYFYVSYVLVFSILGMHGLWASVANILIFMVLNLISDKLCDNLIKDLHTK